MRWIFNFQSSKCFPSRPPVICLCAKHSRHPPTASFGRFSPTNKLTQRTCTSFERPAACQDWEARIYIVWLVATARFTSQSTAAVYFDRIRARWDILAAARRWSLIEKWIISIGPPHTSAQLKFKADTLCVEISNFSGVSAAGRIRKLYFRREMTSRGIEERFRHFRACYHKQSTSMTPNQRRASCLLRLANTRSCSRANKIPQKLTAHSPRLFTELKTIFSFKVGNTALLLI